MNNLFRVTVSVAALFIIFRIGYNRTQRQMLNNTAVAGNGRVASFSLLAPGVPARNSSFRLNGMPTSIDMYSSVSSIEEEVSAFERKWRARGYEPLRKAFGRMRMISVFDKGKKLFDTVIVLPDPLSGKTMVIPAKIDLKKKKTGRPRTPLFPNAKPLFHLESNDFVGYSENLILISDARVRSVMDFYTSRLTREGWKIARQPQAAFDPRSAEMRLFIHGVDERWVSASKVDGQDKTVIFLLYNDKY